MIALVSFEIDTDHLENWTDTHLAAMWHVAQANPAPMDDVNAVDLAEKIGREIIRRFCQQAGTQLWNHQGSHRYFTRLLNLEKELEVLSAGGATDRGEVGQ